MKADKGYVKAYRRAWENPVFLNFRDASIWQYLFQNAVWEAEGRTVRFDGRSVTLERGQIITSIRFLAEGFCISEKVVRRVLEGIEKGGMAALRRAHGGTVVTICNYSDYQESSIPEGHAEGTRRARDGHAEGTNTNEVNEPKEGSLSSDLGKPNPTGVPQEWQFDEPSLLDLMGAKQENETGTVVPFTVVSNATVPAAMSSVVATVDGIHSTEKPKRPAPRKPPSVNAPAHVMEAFNEFWAKYPQRRNGSPKAESIELFAKMVAAGFDPQDIIRGAVNYGLSEPENIGTEFIMQSVKFLRKKRWLDYQELPQPRSNVHPLRPGQQGHAERQPFRPKHAGVVV